MQNKKFLRSERLSDLIHKELAIIIFKFCQDPRLSNLTITNVKLSNDLSIARVYFTTFNSIKTSDIVLDPAIDQKNIKQILTILKNASNFLKTQLAHKMSLRKIPELKFFYDENTAHGIKMDNLFAKINQCEFN